MNYYVSAILSFSVILSTIIGWIRFRKMDPAFYPFLFLVTVASLNEITSFVLINYYRSSNAINTNIYLLLEGLLILWLFNKWKLIINMNRFYGIVALFVLSWFIEVAILSNIFVFCSYYIVISALVTVLLSIHMLNRVSLNIGSGLVKSPIFLICICFIILYTYSLLIEIFWIWGLDASKIFRQNIYRIFYYINLFCNLIYALAMLWIPKKREFIQLS